MPKMLTKTLQLKVVLLCVIIAMIQGTSRTAEIPTGTIRINSSVDKSVAEVHAGMAILNATRCGKKDHHIRIVHSSIEADLSEYPWMALLVYTDGVDKYLGCDGSLINERYVLTAAHCIQSGNRTLMSVRLGEHDTNTNPDCGGRFNRRICAEPVQEIDIEEAIYHEDYSESDASNDIGLIRLASNVKIGASVYPICLPIIPRSQSANSLPMLITGWDRLETGERSNVLQEALVRIQDINSCQKVIKSFRLSVNHLCAVGNLSELNMCRWNFGGPMFFNAIYQRSSRYIQYGIALAGGNGCDSNYTGIYLKVMPYIKWIAGNISP